MNRKTAQTLVDIMKLSESEDIISNMNVKYKYIHVMEAYAKGEEVQMKPNTESNWVDTESPKFNREDAEYRVKPKSEVVWFRVYKDSNGLIGVWVEDTLDALFDTSRLPYPDCEWINSPACTKVDRPYRSFK